MPSFSINFVDLIIEPIWKLAVVLQWYYLERIISNKEILFSPEELQIIESENQNYSRGYESDDEEETNGLEGLLKELIKFLTISLENTHVMKKVKNYLPLFLLSVKNYCMISNEIVNLWINDPNYFVSDEYNEPDDSSLRVSCLKLIKSILAKIDNDNIFGFIKALISEFQNDQNNQIYSSMVSLDGCPNTTLLIKNLNENKDYILRKCEANILIIGGITKNIKNLIRKNKLEFNELKEINNFLHNLLLEPSSILSDRAVWCLGKISKLFVNEKQIMLNNLMIVFNLFLREDNKLSTNLISSICLSDIANIISTKYKDGDILESNLINFCIEKNIKFLKLCSEETINIPIESIIAISKLNMQSALANSSNYINSVLEVYLSNYNDSNFSKKLVDLIQLWSKDIFTQNIVLEFFFKLFIYITDDYFGKLSKHGSAHSYLDIRKNINFKISDPQLNLNSENIPVKFLF